MKNILIIISLFILYLNLNLFNFSSSFLSSHPYTKLPILLLFTSLQYYNTKTAVRQTKKCEIIAIKAVFYERSRLDLLFL